MFENSVFMGDSIIGALSYLGKLDKEKIIAPSGATIDLLQLNVPRLVHQQPEQIFILIGSNDMKLSEREPFIEKYSNFINSIEEQLPNTSINILSITPVSAEALSREPRYEEINAYNKSLQDLAATENVNYIDLSPLFEN